MKRFKFQFTQFVKGVEHCEVIIEANNQVEALSKFEDRDFTTYLCTKQEVERVAETDSIESFVEVT